MPEISGAAEAALEKLLNTLSDRHQGARQMSLFLLISLGCCSGVLLADRLMAAGCLASVEACTLSTGCLAQVMHSLPTDVMSCNQTLHVHVPFPNVRATLQNSQRRL